MGAGAGAGAGIDGDVGGASSSVAPAGTAAAAPAVPEHLLPWFESNDVPDNNPLPSDPLYHNFDTSIKDEYDPGYPNDYEALCEVLRVARGVLHVASCTVL
jgi:hypothetical protein